MDGGMEACEESAKTAKRRSSSKQAGCRRPGRRWPWSTYSESETAAKVGGRNATTLLSTTTTVVATDDGDRGGVVVMQQARGGGKPGVGARLSRKLKEQRARFYIVRRCVSMLVCWRDADA